ncbi:MetS family NSS transporter small subunit [Biomaibacter acetigenes]|uniref:MetS family NSS transporter small subunit n=1 Tax=Biomaibacter acetigenes TaxID=2316383 RepID=A0A3G2R9N3_9FIRM|nr:MetS family NSS transporter small subunit [Biomaibacter acetigenes]RKL64475.1 MetS family NSS transporter small subunit [Thermoanaerobacteraceae bacterium SP2]
MEPGAIVMLIFGLVLLYGGLATFITIAIKRVQNK